MTTCPSCSTPVGKDDRICPVCKNSLAEKPVTGFQILKKMDIILAAICLTTMIGVVLAQIILRNFFQSGLAFGDDLVRHLVLWVVFFGAGIAARENRHIRIDVMARFFSPRINRIVDFVVAVFSTAICLILSYGAFIFVREEYTGGITLSMFDMPVWIAQSIIPLGYLIISIHLALSGIAAFRNKEKP